ncbi:TPA: 3-oxoacyl-ACP reductase FabG [Streptococcus agalactiae]
MKVAIVTGGTRGIGRAITKELYKEGYRVIAIYNSNDAKARALQEELPKLDVYKCNISDAKAVQKLVTKIFREYGGIDCLVNNAGIVRDGFFLMMSKEKWMDVININIMGLVNMSKAVLKIMKAKRIQGKVINISSTSGIAGQIGQANYSATKGAIISITKTLAKEFASDGITINCVSPGFIETDMTNELQNKEELKEHLIPLKRFGQPEEVAWLVSFLASEKANYITGKNIVIDGGMIND